MTRNNEATISTKEIKAWAAAQQWATDHDPDGWDGYCVIQRLCDEVDRLRAEQESGREMHRGVDQ